MVRRRLLSFLVLFAFIVALQYYLYLYYLASQPKWQIAGHTLSSFWQRLTRTRNISIDLTDSSVLSLAFAQKLAKSTNDQANMLLDAKFILLGSSDPNLIVIGSLTSLEFNYSNSVECHGQHWGHFSDCSNSGCNSSLPMTHLFVYDNSTILLYVQLTRLFQPKDTTTSHAFYCSGIRNVDALFHFSSCPPCLCSPMIFDGASLKQLQIDDMAIYNPTPSMLSIARQLLQYSQFVDCASRRQDGLADFEQVGDSPEFPAVYPNTVRQLFQRFDMPLMLESGTLLGWYRNCSVIPGDVDMDFAVPSFTVDDAFYAEILKMADVTHRPFIRKFNYIDQIEASEVILKTSRIFGNNATGVEVTFDAWRAGSNPNSRVRIDIFVVYFNTNQSTEYANYIPGFIINRREIIHYALPDDLKLCSTLFLSEIYLVPCDPVTYLAASYGEGWLKPTGRIKDSWKKQPNIKGRIFFSRQDWKRQPMYRGF